MELGKIAFVAGDWLRLASIKIRCKEIAERLSCAVIYGQKSVANIPLGYGAYVCVKPDFGAVGLEQLQKRGLVIWDVLDDDPPKQGVDLYIVSSNAAKIKYQALGRIEVIPHYHCNFERHLVNENLKTISYIGNKHWYPELGNIIHDRYFVHGWTREQVAAAYARTGLCINLRKISESAQAHLQINSGIKLLNCMAYGIPSVCAEEPAYREFGPDCAMFCGIEHCAASLLRLIKDRDLYLTLRQNCIRSAPEYHIDEILGKYKRLFSSL